MNKKIMKVRSGYYDPNAPKFRYVKDIMSFTRKTNRVVKGEDLQLFKESIPSKEKRKGSLYPWTKPMKGWKRIYIGKGRWIAQGRHSRKKQGVQPITAPVKAPRRGFTPYKRTYLWKEQK